MARRQTEHGLRTRSLALRHMRLERRLISALWTILSRVDQTQLIGGGEAGALLAALPFRGVRHVDVRDSDAEEGARVDRGGAAGLPLSL